MRSVHAPSVARFTPPAHTGVITHGVVSDSRRAQRRWRLTPEVPFYAIPRRAPAVVLCAFGDALAISALRGMRVGQALSGCRRPIWEISSVPIGGAPMLDPVHDHDIGHIVDAVDDPIVATPSGEQPVELCDERLAESARVLADGAPHSGEGSIADFGRKLVEIADSLGGDPNLIGHQGSGSGGRQRKQLAARGLGPRPHQGLDEVAVAKNVEGFFKRLEIIGAHEHERRASVAGHQDPLMLALHALSELGEVGLGLGERQRVCHRSTF